MSFTEYKVGLPNVLVAFMPQEVVPMAGILAEGGLTQFHLVLQVLHLTLELRQEGGRSHEHGTAVTGGYCRWTVKFAMLEAVPIR